MSGAGHRRRLYAAPALSPQTTARRRGVREERAESREKGRRKGFYQVRFLFGKMGVMIQREKSCTGERPKHHVDSRRVN